MRSFQKKLFFLPIVFLVIFLSLSQAVFSGDYGYKHFQDQNTLKFGFKDSSGNIVIPAKFYMSVRDFSEGLSPVIVEKGQKYVYINKNGKLVIPAVFDYAYSFKEGLAQVYIGDIKGKINKRGDWVSIEGNNNTLQQAQKEKDDLFNKQNNCVVSCHMKYDVCRDDCKSLSNKDNNWSSACYSRCSKELDICKNECF